MIPWIDVVIQGTENPTTTILWTTFVTADLEGMISLFNTQNTVCINF